MNYDIIKSDFKIETYDNSNYDLTNCILVNYYDTNIEYYKMIEFIGSGVIGKIYLLENMNEQIKDKYVIKISNDECDEDLIDEITTFKTYYKANNIIHKLYPKFYGSITNLDSFGIIYPYLGRYNLEKIKTKNIIFTYCDNLNIIIQLITQLKSLTNLIHCDLKSSNVVIDDNNNATIVDIGLLKPINTQRNVFSTNMITSPESILTFKTFVDCVYDTVKLDKHDYFGLFTIVISLFIKVDYWHLISYYLIDELKFKNDFIISHESSLIYVYVWYKFNNKKIKSTSLFNIIAKIETQYSSLLNKKFINYNSFFEKYVVPAINPKLISPDKIILLESFTSLLIKFEPDDRPDYDTLLTHPFLEF